MLSVRHLVAEKLEAERAVLHGRQQLADTESAARAIEDDRFARKVPCPEAQPQQQEVLEAEVKALDAEVHSLRCLQKETQADIQSLESISPDNVVQDGMVQEGPGFDASAQLHHAKNVLEQARGMLSLKLEMFGKKKREIKKLRNRGCAKDDAHQAPVIDVDLIADQQECVALACNSLNKLELQRQKAEAELESARANCVGCALVLHVTLSCDWQKQPQPVPWWKIDRFLKAEWALRCGTEIMPLTVCRPILAAISAARMVPSHVLEVTRSTGVTYLSIGAGDAGQMTVKARTSPVGLSSMDLLKAALGSSPHIVMCQELTDYFHACQDNRSKGVLVHKEVPRPGGMMGHLRPYQQIGFKWLANMACEGLGCVLADDMGLGKTVQCITTLLHLKQHGHLRYPALVVTPLSLISSWTSELGKWAPSLAVHTYLGASRQLLANARRILQTPKPTQQFTGWLKRRSAAGPHQKKKLPCRGQNPPLRRSSSRLLTSRHADIFITSYTTFRSDLANIMEEQQFGAMILDEAQAIKNHSSALSRAAKQLAAEVPIRIAVSGTPVENRVSDLHSLFEFVMPGYLGSRAAFEAAYGRPLGRQGAGIEQAAGLQKLIGHFLLRRLKTDPSISKDLPPRLEQNHFVELTPQQANLYECVRKACMRKLDVQEVDHGALPRLFQKADNCEAGSSKCQTPLTKKMQSESQQKFARRANVFRMLHALRQICNHPSNLDLDKWPELSSGVPLSEEKGSASKHLALPGDAEASGKTMLLHVLLEQIFSQSEKVVIFCQYLKTVDTLFLQIQTKFGIAPQTLVGELSMEERAHRIQEFQQNAGAGAMILTLGVGGTGITLHAARHVIHFDRCYNPAKENQGSDRVHRIGQKATCVFIHRLIARGTFEERVDAILEQKRRLSGLTLASDENWIADLSEEELLSLFEPQVGANNALDRRAPLDVQREQSSGTVRERLGAKRFANNLTGCGSAPGAVKFHRTQSAGRCRHV